MTDPHPRIDDALAACPSPAVVAVTLVPAAALAVVAVLWRDAFAANAGAWAAVGVAAAANAAVGLFLARRCATLNARLERVRRDHTAKAVLLESLLETAPAGILVCDDRGLIVQANEMAARHFDRTHDALIGVSLGEIVGGAGGLSTLESCEQRVLGLSGTLEGSRGDGSTFPLTLAVGRAEHAGRTYFTAVVQDVSDRHRDRKNAEAAAVAKARFLVNVSHELRTPLNGILGMADALDATALGVEQRRLLDILAASAESLSDHIGRILDFARLESGDVRPDCEPFCPALVVGGVVESLADRASERGVSLSFAPADSLPPELRGDGGRVRDILRHLLANAVRFSPGGDVVVRLGYRAEGGFLVLEVSDTGVGIPDDARDRIFEPFEQGDSSLSRSYGGLGLGLAIVVRLVKLLGGRIEVESESGRGSTFRVWLPMDAADGAPAEADPRPSVFVVLADEEERRVMTGLLGDWGFQAVGLPDGAGLLTRYYEALVCGSLPSLILLDEQLRDGPASVFLMRLPERPAPCGAILFGNTARNGSTPMHVREVLPRNCRASRLRAAVGRHSATVMA